jgi:hypothetical protein
MKLCNTQALLHKMNDDNPAGWALVNAIKTNDTTTASSLISSGSVNLNISPWPLHFAARYGRVAIMTMLLDAGADINAVDNIQRTACHIAILCDQFDALKFLVERGASLGVVDSYGHSLLSSVAQYVKDERFVLLLLDAGAPLDHVPSYGLMALVKSVAVFNRLMASNVDFDTMRDKNGATLCHYVSRNVTCEDDLRFLVNVCGKDAIHAVDSDGRTPLHRASLKGNESAVRVLVELGAEIDRQDNWGRSALINAADSSRPSCVELLVALGAGVHLVTISGRTACHFAALYDRAPVCALVAAGGNLDQPDNNGESPRVLAVHMNVQLPTADEIEAARHRIAKTRLDLVRERAFQICHSGGPDQPDRQGRCHARRSSQSAVCTVPQSHQCCQAPDRGRCQVSQLQVWRRRGRKGTTAHDVRTDIATAV